MHGLSRNIYKYNVMLYPTLIRYLLSCIEGFDNLMLVFYKKNTTILIDLRYNDRVS